MTEGSSENEDIKIPLKNGSNEIFAHKGYGVIF